MHQKIAEILESIGLSPNESEVYLKLLEIGRSKASDLVKETTFARGVVYFLLDQLEHKGLVAKIPKGKQFLYQAQHPSELLTHADNELRTLESSKAALSSMVPMLSELYSQTAIKPVVHYYEGIEGVKKVYKDTLLEGKTIYAAMQSGPVNENVHTWVRSKYAPQRVKQGIQAKVIMTQDERVEMFVKENKARLREMVVVDKDVFPIKIEVNIYGNKVGYISSHIDSDLFGVIIDSKFVAQTMLALWRLAWIGGGGLLDDSGDG